MKPNVCVIVVDALRWDRVGSLSGNELTPAIDALSNESVLFTNAFSTTNVTDVAITSIQTGRYPLSHGVVNHGTRVTDDEKSVIEKITQLPEVLSEVGYRTAKFGRPLGRWHRNGFDIYPSFMEDTAAFDNKGSDEKPITWRIGATLERVHPKLRTAASRLHEAVSPTPGRDELISEYHDQSDEVVREFEKFVERDSEPFYSFIHLMDTHSPYDADPELVNSYLKEFDYETHVPVVGAGTHPELFDRLVEMGEYPEIEEKYYLPDGTPTTAVTDAHYDASVTQADRRVEALLATLKKSRVYDDTLIVLVADHGESLTEHGIYYDHHGLYDVSTRVPLVVRPPGGADREVDDLVQITDIAPTIESYAGTDQLDADGYSLQSVIEADESINRHFVLADERHTQRRRMVRSTESKLIYSLDDDTVCRYCNVQHAPEIEFYDLTRDPGESNNLARERTSKVEKLRAHGDQKAKELEKRHPDETSSGVVYDDEDELEKRLKALGYR